MSDPHKLGRCEGHHRNGVRPREGFRTGGRVRVEGGRIISLRELLRSVGKAADAALSRRAKACSRGLVVRQKGEA